MKTIVFACVHNAGRSQMAAAWFNALVDPGKAHAESAGTAPAAQVHPEVVEVMQEVGVDLSREVPKRLSDALGSTASLLVTMGCGEACPAVAGVCREDWPLEMGAGWVGTGVRLRRRGCGRGRSSTSTRSRSWCCRRRSPGSCSSRRS
ncbi:uncharacterized protein CMC5_028310 [Chondromyces crocatus]|uniref:Phosphotyrosine protein phosphatase I domain-containing protein n=1 Tax=Chondromyces crocatus TaxID=52 RepID=A0A0K1EDP2_CHOCO|nr:uncharacterized protein CMC5_028310 [Chondromyces crocatus]